MQRNVKTIKLSLPEAAPIVAIMPRKERIHLAFLSEVRIKLNPRFIMLYLALLTPSYVHKLKPEIFSSKPQ